MNYNGLPFRRQFALTTRECFLFLKKGYVLQNENGYEVWLECGKQVITNDNRRNRRRGRGYAYKFDYPTWLPLRRLPWWKRVKNSFCTFMKGL